MLNRVLTVCTGNICRSPLAEALLRAYFASAGRPTEVISAGLGALIGHPADATTSEVAAEHGVDLTAHRAQQINLALVRQSDLVLVMERGQLEHLVGQYTFARGKTFLLGHWSQTEVPDPYRKPREVHQTVYDIIGAEVGRWQGRL